MLLSTQSRYNDCEPKPHLTQLSILANPDASPSEQIETLKSFSANLPHGEIWRCQNPTIQLRVKCMPMP